MLPRKAMATLTFSFDTGPVTLSEIIDVFATAYNYQATVNGQPNPESKAQFTRRMVRQYIRDIYIAEKDKIEQAKIVKANLQLD